MDILAAWESWTGSGKKFYSGLGTTSNQMGFLMGRLFLLIVEQKINMGIKKNEVGRKFGEIPT